MNNEDELQAARIELSDLQDQAKELQANLERAINDADAAAIINIQDQIRRKNVFVYTVESKILRLEKQGDEADRNIALYEQKLLEEQLAKATAEYVKASDIALDKKYVMNLIQAKLFANDGRIATDRENINSKDQKIRQQVAGFINNQANKQPEAN